MRCRRGYVFRQDCLGFVVLITLHSAINVNRKCYKQTNNEQTVFEYITIKIESSFEYSGQPSSTAVVPHLWKAGRYSTLRRHPDSWIGRVQPREGMWEFRRRPASARTEWRTPLLQSTQNNAFEYNWTLNRMNLPSRRRYTDNVWLGWSVAFMSLYDFVCLCVCVRVLKEKRLKLSTQILIESYSAWYSLSTHW